MILIVYISSSLFWLVRITSRTGSLWYHCASILVTILCSFWYNKSKLFFVFQQPVLKQIFYFAVDGGYMPIVNAAPTFSQQKTYSCEWYVSYPTRHIATQNRCLQLIPYMGNTVRHQAKLVMYCYYKHQSANVAEHCHSAGHCLIHYGDVIMGTTASQITSLTIVCSTVYSGVDQRKYKSSASLAFVRGIHRDRWIPRTKGQ